MIGYWAIVIRKTHRELLITFEQLRPCIPPKKKAGSTSRAEVKRALFAAVFDAFELTDAEEELLLSKKRGHALFVIGSKRLHVHFEIPLYKFEYFGSAGGR